VRHHSDDFGKEFDAFGMQVRVNRAGAEGDASPEAEDESALRRGMEEKRDVSVTKFGNDGGGAAHLKAIVDEERAVAVGAFGNSNSGHAADTDFAQGGAGRDANQRFECGNIWEKEHRDERGANRAAKAVPE
jgi:hypothetical protein